MFRFVFWSLLVSFHATSVSFLAVRAVCLLSVPPHSFTSCISKGPLILLAVSIRRRVGIWKWPRLISSRLSYAQSLFSQRRGINSFVIFLMTLSNRLGFF